METAGSQERVIRYDAEALRAAALPLDSGQSVEMPFVLTARAKLCRNVAVSAILASRLATGAWRMNRPRVTMHD